MGDGIDEFVEDLKEQIFDETKEAYGEVSFQRWKNPKFVGSMEDPDGYASVNGGCGDTMEFFLKFEDDRVLDASFQSTGCGSSTVCGSTVAEMTIGKKPDEIKDITGEAVIHKLGRIPTDDGHLPFLAVETLRSALENYLTQKDGSTDHQSNGS